MHHLHGVRRPLNQLFTFYFTRFKPVGNIFLNTYMRKYGIILEYHTDISFCRGNIIYNFIIKKNTSFIDFIKTRNHSKKRRFPATRRP